MKHEQELTIVEHLAEFRTRFLWTISFFFISFLVSLYFSTDLYRLLTQGFSQKLVVLGPDDILWIYLNLASLMAFTLTLPFLTYQVWAFLVPALEKAEARSVFWYIPAVFLCFLAGLLFGFYLVSPALLQVLLSLGEDLFDTQLTAQNYLTFLLHTTIPMAIIFELPVLVAFLTSIGILSPRFLVQYRRHAYFSLLVLAVIITPADFISDLAMTIPLLLIYEVSVAISRWLYRRKEKRRTGYGNLT
ncbi:twin arginine-targeting protein translocase TatC [Streptococcus azizii]|uniref:Sec-independent protein translocase protein TatC n=1 Tax=Streptococcus azizii TaxID=1579424 RepID=A0AB36JLH5_9STRE|nr:MULTISPECIES: twin-arginine translocase subunit TatC [Streptococcus]MBF0775417.1 twin-arginine translocase subunit TatC [Streptococcus sp. 19428wD3_AN2]ONK26781.1 twin arginine-targeting protein translocase TatC [Streptococcus azizii]ONK27348.1 twin arginine-targeting protein translocase TatC [Streptococcus azizii]ONK28292.1 twin arginine-targeting protein translocase TatC [Streptococcus azizii]TFU84584.1 twin-arginine translocase subunit TatC [Streptococcus sp. AN2]